MKQIENAACRKCYFICYAHRVENSGGGTYTRRKDMGEIKSELPDYYKFNAPERVKTSSKSGVTVQISGDDIDKIWSIEITFKDQRKD